MLCRGWGSCYWRTLRFLCGRRQRRCCCCSADRGRCRRRRRRRVAANAAAADGGPTATSVAAAIAAAGGARRRRRRARTAAAAATAGAPASVAAALVAALPAAAARALAAGSIDEERSDFTTAAEEEVILQRQPSNDGGTNSGALAKSRRQLKAAAKEGCLVSFVAAVDTAADGGALLWQRCVAVLGGALAATTACEGALCAAWPMLHTVACAVSSRKKGEATAAGWGAGTALCCATARVPLAVSTDATQMREKAAALVREAARLLIAGESEAQRAAATHALGQLRGPVALQLLLVEIGPTMRSCSAAHHGPSRTAHASVACVLALGASQPDWPNLLVTCGAPLASLASWLPAALDHAAACWGSASHQLTRRHLFSLLRHAADASVLEELRKQSSAERRDALLPSELLQRVSSILRAPPPPSPSAAAYHPERIGAAAPPPPRRRRRRGGSRARRHARVGTAGCGGPSEGGGAERRASAAPPRAVEHGGAAAAAVAGDA